MIDFAGLYREHARELHRFALFLGGDAALADDLVAETFVRLWSARERLDLSTVRGYLYTIARNLFLHDRRRRRTAAPAGGRGPAEGVLDALPDRRPDPERSALDRDELRATLEALQELPELDRAAILLRADGELGYEEIGAALGLSAGAARVKVHRARQRLAAARARREPTPRPSARPSARLSAHLSAQLSDDSRGARR
jgi:RNA polymerase sigma-70 factor (ECF subfamily)